MQFIHDGVFHKVARITGPTHNLLALQFAQESYAECPAVDVLRSGSKSRLNADAVIREVVTGVDEANDTFGTKFRVAMIQFIDDDSPPYSIYRLLAFSLVERLAKNLPFAYAPRNLPK